MTTENLTFSGKDPGRSYSLVPEYKICGKFEKGIIFIVYLFDVKHLG